MFGRVGVVFALMAAVVLGLLVSVLPLSQWHVATAGVSTGDLIRVDAGTTSRLIEWRRIDQTPQEDLAVTLGVWRSRGGNNATFDISFAVDAADAGVPAAQTYKTINNYVLLARKNRMTTSAVAGDPRWVSSSEQTDIVAAAVTGYNAAYPTARLTSLTYDVETWSADAMSADPQGTVQVWLTWVRSVVGKTPGVKVGFHVPYWFDGRNPAVATVEFEGVTATPAQHLARVLSVTTNAFVDVMSYQDTVARTVAAVTPWSNLGVRFQVAIEIGPSDPGSTWFGHPWSDAVTAINAVEAQFGSNPKFVGVDVDSSLYLV